MSTARQDLLIAQIRTAQTKCERRAAVREFTSPSPAPTAPSAEDRSAANVLMRSALRIGGRFEERAASEASPSGGGDLVAPLMGSVIRYLKEYNSLLADVEVYPTASGASMVRPQVSSLVAAPSAAVSENTDVADSSGTLPVFAGQQSFGQTPNYPITLYVSNQLAEDSQTDAIDLMSQAAAEAIGRKLAALLSGVLYGAATTGQEVALGSLTVDKVAGMLAAIDPAYLPGARLYVSAGDFATLAGNDPTGLRNLSALIPGGVKVSNAVTSWSTGTVSGPILADLSSFATWRRVPGNVTVSREARAELAQTLVVVNMRADFAVTGRTTSAVFAK